MRRSTTFIIVLLLPAIAAAQSLPFTVVARTGESAAGISGGTYNSLGFSPRIGSGGHVTFNSSISGVPSSTDFAYWVGLPGSLQVAIREDNGSGATGPDIFSGASNVGVDSSGTLSVWTRLAFLVPANQNEVLYSYLPNGNGGSTTVAREGVTAVPGYTGATWAAIGAGHAVGDTGAVAFIGTAAGGDATTANDFGLWAGTPGNLQLVAREGMSATGASGSATVFSTTNTPIYGKAMNASGQVAFGAELSGPGISTGSSNNRAIYVWSPGGGGSLSLAVQTGDIAPGATGSGTIRFSALDEIPAFNDAGQVAFRGGLASDVPGDITFINNFGVWAGAPGDLQLVYRSNGTVIDGLTLRSCEPYPRINAGGDVAFLTVVIGTGVNTTNDRALWLSSDSGIERIAREGDSAPGMAAGVNFNVLDATFAVNALGQVAFGSSLTGTGVVGANDRGLWAGEPGDVHLIAREGDEIDLDPSAGELLKTIQSIDFAKGLTGNFNDSASAGFNDAGQLVWRAQFTDATSAILLTTVPAEEEEEDSADFEEDGDVDGADFLTWQRNVSLTTGATLADGNANEAEDGDVDGDDLAVWEAQFGASVPAAAAVPEPATASGLLCAAAALAWFGRRRVIPSRHRRR